MEEGRESTDDFTWCFCEVEFEKEGQELCGSGAGPLNGRENAVYCQCGGSAAGVKNLCWESG